jgi:hypothetical protein
MNVVADNDGPVLRGIGELANPLGDSLANDRLFREPFSCRTGYGMLRNAN